MPAWARGAQARWVLGLALVALVLGTGLVVARAMRLRTVVHQLRGALAKVKALVPQPVRSRRLQRPWRLPRRAALPAAPHGGGFVPPLRLLDAVLPVRAARPPPVGRGVVLPMHYSDRDAGFVVRLRLGNDNVLVVVDSGSFYLGVATRQCARAQLCSARDAGYDPTETATFLNRTAELHYASLRIQSDLVRDTLVLRVLDAQALGRACDGARGVPALEADDRFEEAVVPAITVHAASAMEGTHSNVVGLMDPRAHTSKEPCFLGEVLSALRLPRRYAVACGANGRGLLVLGAPPARCALENPESRAVPLSRDFKYMGAAVVDVDAVRLLDPATGAVLTTLPKAAVRHAVVDTGTSDSYWPPTASEALLAAGFPASDQRTSAARCLVVELVLRGNLVLRYEPARYLRDGVSTFRLDDPSVNGLFDGRPVLLLGIAQMMGLAWDFDLERRVCVVSPYE